VTVRERYSIELAPTAFRSLRALKDKKTLREIAAVLDGLAHRPENQGKPLTGPLEGISSIRAARSRYRVLFQVDAKKKRVSVLLVGARRPGETTDVYAVARRLFETLAGE
jgi:mRNA-degrading endonuclease RelE of RelBE toxin-antitoxin system